MGTIKDLYELVQIVLERYFGGRVPAQIADLVTIGLLAAVVAAVLFGLFIAFGKAVKVFREDVRPLFYNEMERRRAEKRRRFADHVESEIRRIDNAEEWGDYKFAELEAEVEAEGRRRGLLFFQKHSGLRREKSLSRALRNSKERLVLLEGDPGSGKSVALRYLTSTLARAAMKARSTSAVIPLYINLKNIERRAGVRVDAELIRSHVLKTLNRPNTRNIAEFLDEEFERGMREGAWLFLFDSFDEIPDILSATSADTIVRDYANAIADFLLTLNRCRGIVASRYFRGPGGLAWPRFRILALSDGYRRNLIRRSDLAPDAARTLIGDVELAQGDLNVMSRNPMFLGLLCEYMRMGHPFPENAHVVFESYVTTRLQRDESRLQLRFRTDAVAVRTAAEQAAFCMASEAGLGLSPSRADLAAAMKMRGFTGDADAMLDAIEYIKLARADEHDRVKTFTFAHRRFQEYFATCVVIREPALVPAEALLTDARWRETAVVLLQTQRDVSSLLAEAERRLAQAVAEIEAAIPAIPTLREIELGAARPPRIQFPWPPLALHLLALLQSGFRGRPEQLPHRIRELAGRIVLGAIWVGSLSDRRWVLEIAEPAPQDVVTFALRTAFSDGSTWLGDAAYRQASALREIPPDIAREIRRALVGQFLSGRLRAQRHSTRAFLLRLPGGKDFLHVLQLLLVVRPVDLAICLIVTIGIGVMDQQAWLTSVPLLLLVVFLSSWPLGGRLIDAHRPGSSMLIFRIAMISAVGSIFLREAHSSAILSSRAAWILLIAFLWAPMALIAASAGRLVNPLVSPFLSFYPILRGVQALRNAPQLLRRLRPRWQMTFKDFAAGALAVAVVALIIAGVVAFEILRYVMGTVVFLFFAIFFGALGVEWAKDTRTMMRLRRRNVPWNAADLIAAGREIEDATRRARFVRETRERGAVRQTEADEVVLREHALSLENSVVLPGSKVLIDEWNMLAEHVRAQRAASGAASASSPTAVASAVEAVSATRIVPTDATA